MKSYPHVNQTRKEFLRSKSRELSAIESAHDQLILGAGLRNAFDGTDEFGDGETLIRAGIKKCRAVLRRCPR